MADFTESIITILEHEGGYVDHPKDPGGATNFGISIRFLKDHIEDGDLDNDGAVTKKDIRLLTPEHAAYIYKKYFWDANGYDYIDDNGVATKVFDMCVNMGARRAHILFQTAINAVSEEQIGVDGAIGPTTLRVANSCDGEQLLQQIREEQAGFYNRLVEQNPQQYSVFLNGWLKRAYS